MKGDAGEYIHLLKRSLLAEVNAQCGEDEDYDNDLIKSITKYWDMFNSGLTEKSIQCSVCKNVTKQQFLLRNSFCILTRVTMMITKSIIAALLVSCSRLILQPMMTTLSVNAIHAMRGRDQQYEIAYVAIQRSYVLFYVAIYSRITPQVESYRQLIFQLKTLSRMNISESMRELMIRHTTLLLQ
jgi:hypothetical protein